MSEKPIFLGDFVFPNKFYKFKFYSNNLNILLSNCLRRTNAKKFSDIEEEFEILVKLTGGLCASC